MKELVVTINKTGGISTLRDESVIDLRRFGDVQVERITSIEFHRPSQHYYIKWLRGPFEGSSECNGVGGERRLVKFGTYNEAVAYEIKRVNQLRLEGYCFD